LRAYFISGLGADERVFRHIRLPNGYTPIHIPWLKPEPNESLRNYAMRLSESIDTREPFILVGLSFGGMLATEIADTKKPELLVLISSLPSSKHMPPYFRWAGAIGLHKVVPIQFLKKISYAKRVFSPETSEDKRLLREMIREADPGFIRWAIGAILHWKHPAVPQRFIHIHGTRDGILPHRFTRPTHAIRGAGHLLVLNRAEEISSLIAESVQLNKN